MYIFEKHLINSKSMKLKLLFFIIIVFQFVSFAQCPPDGVFFSQAEIDAFAVNYPNCDTLPRLRITGLDNQESDIDDLTPLSNLINPGWSVYIENNPLLESLAGLDNLQSDNVNITSLRIVNNTALSDISSLSGLTACSSIVIYNNNQLTNLYGLDSITYIGDENQINTTYWLIISDNENLVDISALSDLVPYNIEGLSISHNPSLTSLQGLENFDTMSVLNIENNDALLDLNGLNGVTTLYDEIRIISNDLITDLTGLSSVQQTGYFKILDNDMLASLNGINQISFWVGIEIMDNESLIDLSAIDYFDESTGLSPHVYLIGNTSLEVCNYPFICNLMDDFFSISQVQIENNSVGCNSELEITNACEIPPVNNDLNDCTFRRDIYKLNIGQEIIGSNTFATASSYTPLCNDITERQDVWYYIEQDSDVMIDINVTNGFSIQLWQLAEGDCGIPDFNFNMTQVPNTCGTGSIQDISITANTIYFVQVWDNTSGRSTIANEFEITLQDSTLSINNFDVENIKVFPNPVSNSLQVKGVDNADTTLEIFNALGQTIKSSKGNSIDMSELNSGVYFLSVKSSTKNLIRRVIKE